MRCPCMMHMVMCSSASTRTSACVATYTGMTYTGMPHMAGHAPIIYTLRFTIASTYRAAAQYHCTKRTSTFNLHLYERSYDLRCQTKEKHQLWMVAATTSASEIDFDSNAGRALPKARNHDVHTRAHTGIGVLLGLSAEVEGADCLHSIPVTPAAPVTVTVLNEENLTALPMRQLHTGTQATYSTGRLT